MKPVAPHFMTRLAALGAQALMTGTGAELFVSLGTDAQRFQVREVGGESRIEEAMP